MQNSSSPLTASRVAPTEAAPFCTQVSSEARQTVGENTNFIKSGSSTLASE